MKSVLLSVICITILSCKETPKEIKKDVKVSEKVIPFLESAPVANLNRLFEAHGGLENWKNKRTLSFAIPKKNANEIHTIDLYSRKEKIETAEFTMGFDGENFWLLNEQQRYKGDPVFYHNLMFYFYSMPFVLADAGIMYSDAEALEFEGNLYPGIRISYNNGVGLSAKDEYFVHYNPETFQMEWLGYTVTFKSGEKSDNIRWIRYNDWMNVNGLVLPRSLTWYEYKGRTIKEAREPLNFENVTLSETAQSAGFFAQPDGAKTVESKIE